MQPSVGWLTRVEMEAMLAVPGRKTDRGQHDYALLLFLYNSDARVSEATGLKAQDLSLAARRGDHAIVTLHGKGGKTSQCPLWPETDRALAHEIRDGDGNAPVFLSRLGTGYTRFGAIA